MGDNTLVIDKRAPSEKFKLKDVKSDEVCIEKVNGEKIQVSFLPTSEMPTKQIFGAIDPLEGSPARLMSQNLMKGELMKDFVI